MKKLALALSLSVLALTGCKSTSENKSMQPASVDIVSSEAYQWDESKSVAMNITEMAKPAGVGFGLSDVQQPKELKIKRDSNSLLSSWAGFGVGGLGGALGFLAMDDTTKNKRTWSPAFITFHDAENMNMVFDILYTK